LSRKVVRLFHLTEGSVLLCLRPFTRSGC